MAADIPQDVRGNYEALVESGRFSWASLKAHAEHEEEIAADLGRRSMGTHQGGWQHVIALCEEHLGAQKTAKRGASGSEEKAVDDTKEKRA